MSGAADASRARDVVIVDLAPAFPRGAAFVAELHISTTVKLNRGPTHFRSDYVELPHLFPHLHCRPSILSTDF